MRLCRRVTMSLDAGDEDHLLIDCCRKVFKNKNGKKNDSIGFFFIVTLFDSQLLLLERLKLLQAAMNDFGKVGTAPKHCRAKNPKIFARITCSLVDGAFCVEENLRAFEISF